MNFDLSIKNEILREQTEMLKSYINKWELPYLLEYSKQWRIFEMILRRVTKKDSIDLEDWNQLYDEFESMVQNINLTNEEKVYLAYNKYKRHFNESDKNAEWDILLRRKLIEVIGNGSIEKAIEILKRNHFEYPSDIQFAIELIGMENWEGRETLEKTIQENVEAGFNMRMNCGGYALKADTCIFGGVYKNTDINGYLNKNVSSLLEKFPYIRLLGDTELGEDEYIVAYRVNDNGGHHFIRIESDGTIKDKNESKPPRVLESLFNEKEVWGESLKDCPQAIFAVKNNHDIHAQKYSYILNDGQDFEETVLYALNIKNSEFQYHNRNYSIVNDKENTLIYSNGEIVATIISDESGTIIVEKEEKLDYISNTKSSTFEKYIENIKTIQQSNDINENDEIKWEIEL